MKNHCRLKSPRCYFLVEWLAEVGDLVIKLVVICCWKVLCWYVALGFVRFCACFGLVHRPNSQPWLGITVVENKFSDVFFSKEGQWIQGVVNWLCITTNALSPAWIDARRLVGWFQGHWKRTVFPNRPVSLHEIPCKILLRVYQLASKPFCFLIDLLIHLTEVDYIFYAHLYINILLGGETLNMTLCTLLHFFPLPLS